MSTGKRILITVIVSVVLVGIISFLMYVIYTFGYYNKNEINSMTYKFNTNDFEYVYNNLTEKLDKDKYDRIISIMYDKSTLKDIYYLYYSRSEYNIADFYNEFYYGDKNVSSSDIDFNYNGKTTLFKKSIITYNYINVTNKNGSKSAIGIINNVTLNVDNGSELYIDNEKVECNDNKCYFDKIYGGIHEIRYVNNKITYYGLLNIVKNDSEINISTLNSLIRINGKTELKSVKDVSQGSIDVGIYGLSNCYLDDNCGNKKRSYLNIYEDNRVELYLYYSYEVAGSLLTGTWHIDGNNIIFEFTDHIYSLYDYDYKEVNKIETKVDITKKYKIINNRTINNNEYRFDFEEEFEEEEIEEGTE